MCPKYTMEIIRMQLYYYIVRYYWNYQLLGMNHLNNTKYLNNNEENDDIESDMVMLVYDTKKMEDLENKIKDKNHKIEELETKINALQYTIDTNQWV